MPEVPELHLFKNEVTLFVVLIFVFEFCVWFIDVPFFPSFLFSTFCSSTHFLVVGQPVLFGGNFQCC